MPTITRRAVRHLVLLRNTPQ